MFIIWFCKKQIWCKMIFMIFAFLWIYFKDMFSKLLISAHISIKFDLGLFCSRICVWQENFQNPSGVWAISHFAKGVRQGSLIFPKRVFNYGKFIKVIWLPLWKPPAHFGLIQFTKYIWFLMPLLGCIDCVVTLPRRDCGLRNNTPRVTA